MAAEALYTRLKTDHCKTLSEDQGGVSLSCPGLKGYPILYKEGDLRPSLFYGPLDPVYAEGAFESLAAFASVNDTVEWRIVNKEPVAAILRYFVSNTDPETGETPDRLKGQVLVISKVASPRDRRSCVIGLVDALANRSANDLARKIADEKAADFVCGRDKPEYEGEKGPLSSDFSSNLPSL